MNSPLYKSQQQWRVLICMDMTVMNNNSVDDKPLEHSNSFSDPINPIFHLNHSLLLDHAKFHIYWQAINPELPIPVLYQLRMANLSHCKNCCISGRFWSGFCLFPPPTSLLLLYPNPIILTTSYMQVAPRYNFLPFIIKTKNSKVLSISF